MDKSSKSSGTSVASASRGPAHTPGSVDFRILRALRRIIQAVDIHSRKLAAQYKITTPQLITLHCVLEDGPITLSEISQRVNVSTSTIVGILDRLEAKGYVKRERSIDDRRQVFVSATPTGAALVQSAPSPLQDVLVGALHRLTPAEQEEIAVSLEAVVELMQAREIDAAPILEVGELKRTLDRD